MTERSQNMETYKMPLDKWFVENGMTLNINISFTETDDGKMELLSFAVHDSCRCVDYSSVVNQTTLVDILKEFIH